MIGITLVKDNKEIDLLVPSKVTMHQLKELIYNMFEHHGIALKYPFQLVVKNKCIHIGEYDVLEDYGIATGDKFEMIIDDTHDRK
ncbi:hypothetical protein GMA11_02065 [Granulicatella sp. zg-ZJ]|uniref:hypothetical protein n=1 Tax=Granulicatella sp. zg-ZJ TaxID=2678504 RepID=UPI0013D49FA7|nr:hypothetical protein [Granulicatella sp. zg-ZJ]NEW62172.1 hypothetical protein [Granulicatella sp. zg-ZJ]